MSRSSYNCICRPESQIDNHYRHLFQPKLIIPADRAPGEREKDLMPHDKIMFATELIDSQDWPAHVESKSSGRSSQQ